MNTVPLWKLKREIARIFLKQLPELVNRSFTKVFGWLYYDLFLSKHRLVHFGNEVLTSRVCIFVIFPENDVTSQLSTIKHLSNNFFSTIVVSNKPLTSVQREKILERSSVVIERFNFGYDFGGYREGFLWLKRKVGTAPEFLFFLNDSCWFPIRKKSAWLEEAVNLRLDYCSPITSATIRKREVLKDFELWWKQDKTSRNFHYCSFALLISQRIFLDQSFYRFFKFFSLTNAKNRTVRRGEIGLTKWVLRSGFSHGETFNIERLLAEFKAMTRLELVILFRELTLLDDINLNKRKSELEEKLDETNDSEVLAFILYTIARQGAAYSIPTYLVKKHNFPFLKKSLVHYSYRNQTILQSLDAWARNQDEDLSAEAS